MHSMSYDTGIMKQNQARIQTITILIGVAGILWFFWPQIATIVFTMLMAYIFYPIFLRLKRKSGRIAAAATLGASFLVVIVPLTIVVLATIGQLAGFADTASRSGTWQTIPDTAKQAIVVINNFMEPLTGKESSFTEQGVIDFMRNTLPQIARASVNILLGMLANIPQLAIAVLIYVFLFVELLMNGPKLVRKIKQLSPFDKETTNLYFERTALMAKAMVTGQLIIALIISAIASLLLIPLGYTHFFFIFLILFTILNFIPLGCGIIVIPLTLHAMVTGQFWLGLVVFVLYYATGWLDPILRPMFIPKKMQLPPALMLLAVFCGVAYFGILGVVYGPIALILILTVIDLYIASKDKSRLAN